MNFNWYLFLASCSYIAIGGNQDLGQSQDLLFGYRTMYVTLPSPLTIGDEPPSAPAERGRSHSGGAKKWQITYLSSEDAKKLIGVSKYQTNHRLDASTTSKYQTNHQLDASTTSKYQTNHRLDASTTSLQKAQRHGAVVYEGNISPRNGVSIQTQEEGREKTQLKKGPSESDMKMPVALPLKSEAPKRVGPFDKHQKEISQTSPGYRGYSKAPSEGSSTPTRSSNTPDGGSKVTLTSPMPSVTLEEGGESSFAPTEGLEVISSTSDERLPLLKDSNRDGPQLIFLADDPEAASRIPDLLTTLYDVGSNTRRVKPGFYGSHHGIITEREQDLEPAEAFTLDPSSIQLTPAVQSDREDGDRLRHLSDAFGRQSFFPSRHRPSPPKPRPLKPKTQGSYGSSNINDFTRVTNIEAECQDDYMKIQVRFNGTFDGMVYSSGYSHDLDCIYINGSGRSVYEFYIKLNRCGTLGSNQLEDNRKPMHKSVMWNTLTVQYNPLIEEEWDEHFKVTCEYGLEIWKTVTFPFLDVEVQTGNPMLFTLSPPECHMEIRLGFGPDGPRVSSPVRVGDPLTLVIYMRSQYDGFDIVISDCYAHNGGAKTIPLIDSYGCPVDDKLISHFEGQSLRDGLFETQIFAFMKTFRFTGSPALYIECGVRMCHGDCPTQQCHWKRSRSAVKTKSRRSVGPEGTTTQESSSKSNVSESLHLFQSLQVVRDEEGAVASHSLSSSAILEELCFKLNHFGVGAGVTAGLVSLLTSICLILCLRLRRLRKGSDSPIPPQTPSHRTYKSDYAPPHKRRLE